MHVYYISISFSIIYIFRCCCFWFFVFFFFCSLLFLSFARSLVSCYFLWFSSIVIANHVVCMCQKMFVHDRLYLYKYRIYIYIIIYYIHKLIVWCAHLKFKLFVNDFGLRFVSHSPSPTQCVCVCVCAKRSPPWYACNVYKHRMPAQTPGGLLIVFVTLCVCVCCVCLFVTLTLTIYAVVASK